MGLRLVVRSAAAVALGAGVVASIGSGCSSSYDVEPTDGGATEASTPPGPPPIGDDAGDAGGDANDGGPFCAGHPTAVFCRDFDNGAPALFAFDTHTLFDGGPLLVDTADSRSPPASLLLGIPGGPLVTQGASSYYMISTVNRNLDVGAPHTARFGYALKIDDLDPIAKMRTGYFELVLGPNKAMGMYISVAAAKTSFGVQEQLDGGGLSTDVQNLGLPHPVGTWTRVEITVTFGTKTTAAITFDGFDAVPGLIDLPGGYNLGLIGIGLDSGYYSNTAGSVTAVKAHYDDVLVEID